MFNNKTPLLYYLVNILNLNYTTLSVAGNLANTLGLNKDKLRYCTSPLISYKGYKLNV